MDKRVLLTVFVAVGLALGVALLAFGVFMWMNRFPWTSVRRQIEQGRRPTPKQIEALDATWERATQRG
jgi:hypothetical protein